MYHILLSILFLVLPLFTWAVDLGQVADDDSTSNHVTVPSGQAPDFDRFKPKDLILPGALMAYGALETGLSRRFRSVNHIVNEAVESASLPPFKADDYIQYLPAASGLLLDFAGVKGRHRFVDRAVILAMAGAYSAIGVNCIKYTVRQLRPDESTRNSFPSGHTSTAFMGAEFMWQEYHERSMWLGLSGYVVASGVAAMRVYNNRHWVGDVFAGAGLGILSTKLAYWTYPLFFPRLAGRDKRKSTASARSGMPGSLCLVTPYYNGQSGGIAASITF